ncbi:hypothetical protein D030_3084B, partial [Vibrio parahaemolyticus AQ3810]
SPPL